MSAVIAARYDPSRRFLALAVQALDAHQVRVQSLVLAHDLLNTLFSLDKDLKLAALAWLAPTQLALCLTNGTILVYAPAANAVVAELKCPAGVAVSDLHYSSHTNSAWSADIAGNLYEWDVHTYALVQKLALADMIDAAEAVSRVSSVMHNGTPHLLVGTHNVYLVDIAAKRVARTFPAHVQPVVAIEPVAQDPDLFVTAAEGDRFANVYSIAKGSARAVLVGESPIREIALGVHGDASVLAAVTETGAVELFKDPLLEAPHEITKKKRKQHAAAVQSKQATATLTYARPADEIRSPDDEKLHISAIAADDTTLHVSWVEAGSILRFDAVPWLTDAGFAFAGSVTIAKSKQEVRPVAHTVGKHDVVAPKLYHEANVVVTEGSAFQNDVEEEEEEESLAERLEKIGGDKKTGDKKTLKRHNAATLTVVLSQALRNNDHSLLETVLINRDPAVVQNTVAKLDLSLAVVLLERLTERITRQQLRFDQLNFWLKWIVIIHGGVLFSLPNMSNKLASLHAILTKKASTLPRLLELQGRLNMLEQQNTLKREILNGSLLTDADNAESDVEYIEEVDDAIEAGIIDSDGDDIDMDGMDDYDESDLEDDDVADNVAEDEDGLSDVETAVAHNDVLE